MNPRFKSITLLSLQLAAIFYLACTGPLYVLIYRPFWLAMQLSGLALAVWAIATMRLRQLRPGPDLAPHAQLVTSGPYRFIRHPMYLAFLLTFGGLVGNLPLVPRVVAFGIFIVVLVIKAQYEESLLLARFPEYREYQKRTKRLLPFIY